MDWTDKNPHPSALCNQSLLLTVPSPKHSFIGTAFSFSVDALFGRYRPKKYNSSVRVIDFVIAGKLFGICNTRESLNLCLGKRKMHTITQSRHQCSRIRVHQLKNT